MASDNSGYVTLTSSHDPGSLFSVGTTEVNYTAVDRAGNMAAVCAFNVTINGMHSAFHCLFLCFEKCLCILFSYQGTKLSLASIEDTEI